MTALTWDEVGSRTYENGVDHGVLYLTDGTAVPWNGLTSITEKIKAKATSVHYEGNKINELVSLGDFAAVMKAFTYPPEFEELEGLVSVAPGILLNKQSPKMFHLSYRTKISNDVDTEAGYKIHLLYNVFAVPSDKEYASLSDSPDAMEFQWDISAMPEEYEGYSPTAHVVINSLDVDPQVLTEIEETLYGTGVTDPAMLTMAEVFALVNDHFRYRVTDNGDGTFSVWYPDPADVTFVGDEFTMTLVEGTLVSTTYTMETTYEAGYAP